MSGLLALLDDVAGIAKIAAASLDDVAGQAAKAGVKAAGVVIDDAAVTPRFVHGFDASRELPIVAKIAAGSIRNKIVFLLPIALILAAFAPWAITPLLMLGGAYLCFEGAEKVVEALFPHGLDAGGLPQPGVDPAGDPGHLETETVSGAVKTDFILSAEIMTIAMAALPAGQPVWMQALALAAVAVGITALVYGGVALIVKADDVGLWLVRRSRFAPGRVLGRGLVRLMPWLMAVLSVVGTAAMIWVGGSIILHGLAELVWALPYDTIHHLAELAGQAVPAAVSELVVWAVTAACGGVLGGAFGLMLIPVAVHVVDPALAFVRRKTRKAR
jgi:predicted DNA repair protein MutK